MGDKNEVAPHFQFTRTMLRKAPYEYKLRRYRPRSVQREDFSREVSDLERFSSYALPRKAEDKGYAPVKNVVVRRHLRKRELEFLVRRSGMESKGTAEREEMPEIGGYKMEVKEVEEDSSKICYTFDIVNWESAVRDEDARPEPMHASLFGVESRLLLDQDFDVEKWEESIVYDAKMFTPNRMDTHLVLDVNDPNLLFEVTDLEGKAQKGDKAKAKKKGKGAGPGLSKVLNGKYNISNDRYYIEASETLKTTLGIQGVQHAIPALKLAPELYKTYLTREELRFFHRPPLHIAPLSEIRFSPLLPNTSKPSSVLKKKRQLTLRDSASFVLLEYSEEIPPLIMNPGMASIITTFYRKASSRDIAAPETETGSTTILDPKDPSPFMFMGDVRPGESVSSVTNNLFKAPIFFHESADFLAIRCRGSSSHLYYVRKIDRLACVGQTLPMDEAFGPHSRKHNLFCKNRLKVAAYRIFYEKGNKDRKMWIHQLDAMFPHFSEGSKRKWLKEYAECVKKGKDNVWVLKQSAPLLSEEDLRRCVTPEQVCQYESMVAEERRLKDAGIVLASGTEQEGENQAEELKLAVWNLTRNFVNACNGRGLLELTGAGDPTGVGEGASFVRLRIKKERDADEEEKEKRASTAAEQATHYRDELRKIWDAQLASLKSKREIELAEGEVEQKRPEAPAERRHVEQEKPKKILSITRVFVRDSKRLQETEVVTDPRIIHAYMKARKREKKEETRTSLRCGSCGQIGHMKTNKACANYQGKAPEVKKRETKKKHARGTLAEIILSVTKSLFSVPFSIAFHRPVSTKKFPNYLSFVSQPIDLSTVKSKARQHAYARYAEFLADVRQMSANCHKYNGPGHSLSKVSSEMVEMVADAYEKDKEHIAALEASIAESAK